MKVFVSPFFMVSNSISRDIENCIDNEEEFVVVMTDSYNPFLSDNIRAYRLERTLSQLDLPILTTPVYEELEDTQFIDGVLTLVRSSFPNEDLELVMELTDKKVKLKPSVDFGKVKVATRYKTFTDRDLRNDAEAMIKEASPIFLERFGVEYVGLIEADTEVFARREPVNYTVPFFKNDDGSISLAIEINYNANSLTGLACDNFLSQNGYNENKFGNAGKLVAGMILNNSDVHSWTVACSSNDGYDMYEFLEMEYPLEHGLNFFTSESDISVVTYGKFENKPPIITWMLDSINIYLATPKEEY